MRFCDLPHATRHAIRELCEAMGARVECYVGDGLKLSHKPSADRIGWSSQALDLHGVLVSMGAKHDRTWRDPVTEPGDPYANRDGYLFSTVYTFTRDPLPCCSVNSL